MAKVIYCPDKDMPEATEQYGYVFEGEKAVDVTDEKHLRKFKGNPFFEVDVPKASDSKQHKL